MLWMVSIKVLLFIIAIGEVSFAKKQHGVTLSTSLTTSPVTTTTNIFTNNEIKEHNHVWKVVNNACFGQWSGTMQSFRMDKGTNLPILNDNDELLNFRLWAKANKKIFGMDRDIGTWIVWNLQQKGDVATIPLRRMPTAKPSQLKIGFMPGCILRIPANYKEVPRLVVELGYWGEGFRRTVVLEYLIEKQNNI